ncbi:MAG: PIN domain-containing protein [Candidatus Brockarchaeota archaeon]|nr:PIN domain-containing protein [Candidatus Brockarchaeota archaeon]
MRKDKLIFDTGPLLLYFAEDNRVKGFFDEVIVDKAEGYTCEVNIAELYYKTCEKLGREAAEVRSASIRHSKISILPLDERLTRVAGSLKCIHRDKFSLVDAYILAATKMLGGILITTDSRLVEPKIVQAKLIQIP